MGRSEADALRALGQARESGSKWMIALAVVHVLVALGLVFFALVAFLFARTPMLRLFFGAFPFGWLAFGFLLLALAFTGLAITMFTGLRAGWLGGLILHGLIGAFVLMSLASPWTSWMQGVFLVLAGVTIASLVVPSGREYFEIGRYDTGALFER